MKIQGIPTLIYASKGMPIVVDEKVFVNKQGDFIGTETGKLYNKDEYTKKEIFLAEVVHIDPEQQNGMIHLDQNTKEGQACMLAKAAFIGCVLPFVEAHSYGDRKVYRSLVPDEFFNDLEIKFL